MLIDCRSLNAQAVPIPAGLAIMIIHSHVQRGLVGSEYNTRRAQCETAAAHFGVKALRDVSLAQFEAGKQGLDATAARRVTPLTPCSRCCTASSAKKSAARCKASGSTHRRLSARRPPGRDSLAQDILEEFRAWQADRLALSLINRSQLKPRISLPKAAARSA